MTNKNYISDYYVYIHKKVSNGKVFYVGKGSKNRAYDKHKRSDYWKSIVKKHGLIVEIVESGYQDWYASEREKDLILFYGRENLCNMTNGGDGASGYRFSYEQKLKLSKAKKGVKKTDLMRLNMSAAKKGMKHNDISKENMRKSQIGRKHSEETKAKIGISNKGKIITFEMRESIRKALNVPVICSNGMFFESHNHAVEWLKSIGYLKASKANINACCRNKNKSAYGFVWYYSRK